MQAGPCPYPARYPAAPGPTRLRMHVFVAPLETTPHINLAPLSHLPPFVRAGICFRARGSNEIRVHHRLLSVATHNLNCAVASCLCSLGWVASPLPCETHCWLLWSLSRWHMLYHRQPLPEYSACGAFTWPCCSQYAKTAGQSQKTAHTTQEKTSSRSQPPRQPTDIQRNANHTSRQPDSRQPAS